MKLSLQWYLTDYSESLHSYYYILVNVRHKYQSIWLTACQSTEANIQIFSNFEVKYLPLPESYNINSNSP